jgi:hypothetical protein
MQTRIKNKYTTQIQANTQTHEPDTSTYKQSNKQIILFFVISKLEIWEFESFMRTHLVQLENSGLPRHLWKVKNKHPCIQTKKYTKYKHHTNTHTHTPP